ncbi:MAG TPA: glutamate synthase-related protein [Methanotrichaceae archaeon]|nr:glutamate synthase-related protein [Methanotrichaceae archaeon]HQF16383.1 glutamate synthase-related protein [Methanotrichaceae archaeon]HQI91003.1 glutamate synthase-related protein [Methanotrichaceae archaeon]
MKSFIPPEFQVYRDEDRCDQCRGCERQCSFGVHSYDQDRDSIISDESKCAGCQRCVIFCPMDALTIRPSPSSYRPNSSWTREKMDDLKKQAETGGVILTGCGSDKPFRIYWDHMVLNASQVTNPSIDPLREPMELRTFLGPKPDFLKISGEGKDVAIETEIGPNVVVEASILFSAMSYGAISYQAFKSLAMAACDFGTFFNTGEGGLPKELRSDYGRCAVVQVASGRYGIDAEYLNCAAAVEIKVGQGAKPGIGGHLPAEKVSSLVAETRMIPEGTDAISPAPHHDIYSIEDLSMLIYALKEATNYEKPISVKIAAVHNFAAIASGIVRAGADIIAIDGLRGGTGAAPKTIRDNVGIPIELAISSVDRRLRDEGIRNSCSLLAAGGIRCSGDVIKAIALGADGVYIGTAALIAMGCTLCQKCYTGRCNWGICTQDPRLAGRINPHIASRRLTNLLRAWSAEIKEMLGGMGINAIESLRGNRDHLRGVGLYEWELDVLGIKGAGE